MKIAINSDKNGVELKKVIVSKIRQNSIDIDDLSYISMNESADYPDVAINLANKIRNHEYDRGILICGTGLGMAMCANKVPGVFAGVCGDVYSAERLVKSNNAQILCLGALVIGIELAKSIVEAWLQSTFQAGQSLPKVNRMRELDRINFHTDEYE
jgi:ribose 5-phosphate isomerase B